MRPTRRELLEAGAASAALAASPIVSAAQSDLRTKHVVLVAFAGGVRTRETLGMPSNVPTLAALAEEGVTYWRTRTANLGHFGATMSLYTGISEARGIRENARGPDPTLFEYLRKDLGLPASDVWVSTSGGAQQTNYSHSLHPDYGAAYGANVLDGDGIFNSELKQILESYGRPRALEPTESDLLRRMRTSMARGDAAVRSAEAQATLESYILQELSRGTTELRGPNAADAKAMRVARNLLSIFRPKLVSVVLQQADVAHGNYNAYLDVVRQNDAALGELVAAVRADPELAESTAIVVLPEFGRDADLNSRRGLDHGDGSDDLNYVATVCSGPDFRSGVEVNEVVRTIDVCSTVCDLFGADARYARGRRLPRLYS